MFKNRLIPMSLVPKDFNQRLVREITIILIIKVVILLTIKHIWFDAPTIPKNFDNQVAERIAGSPSQIKETR
jgi:hypothetical protein